MEIQKNNLEKLTDYPAIVKQLKIISNYAMQSKLFQRFNIDQ